jgi:hypothetical protein
MSCCATLVFSLQAQVLRAAFLFGFLLFFRILTIAEIRLAQSHLPDWPVYGPTDRAASSAHEKLVPLRARQPLTSPATEHARDGENLWPLASELSTAVPERRIRR